MPSIFAAKAVKATKIKRKDSDTLDFKTFWVLIKKKSTNKSLKIREGQLKSMLPDL